MDTRGILSVMMPIFNEERTLEIILGHVLEQPEVGEVIAVDDGSSDRSWEILNRVAHLPSSTSFRTTWENVFRSVKAVVAWGLAHRSLEGIEATLNTIADQLGVPDAGEREAEKMHAAIAATTNAVAKGDQTITFTSTAPDHGPSKVFRPRLGLGPEPRMPCP